MAINAVIGLPLRDSAGIQPDFAPGLDGILAVAA